jgi:hypothetical protein
VKGRDLAFKEIASNACLLSEDVYKLVNAGSVFEGGVVLGALYVLDTFTAVIWYWNKTRTLALARNQNLLFHKIY